VQPEPLAALDEQEIGTGRAVGEQDKHRRRPAAALGRREQRGYLHRLGRGRQLTQPRWHGRGRGEPLRRGHENGPDLTSVAATTGSTGPSPKEGQRAASPQAPQAGRRE